MSGTGYSLARRYRRLLLCYPREYRRERGEEIVGTLLDLAPPGRDRPTMRQTANLLGHGLRCRLGRPGSRSVVIWAALTAAVWGLFGAAFATRAGWETAQPLPDQATAAKMFNTVFPDEDLSGRVRRSPAMFVVYGRPLRPRDLGTLLLGDGGEYGFGSASAHLPGPGDERRMPEAVVRRLRERGWTVREPRTTRVFDCASSRCDPDTLPTETLVTARRGPDIMKITISPNAGGGETNLGMSLERATPWPVYPIGLAGGLIGAALGWFVFGWASRRTEAGAWPRTGAKALFALATVLWWLPIVWAAPVELAAHLDQAPLRWQPLWVWLGQPEASLLFLSGDGLAIAILSIAALHRLRGPLPLSHHPHHPQAAIE